MLIYQLWDCTANPTSGVFHSFHRTLASIEKITQPEFGHESTKLRPELARYQAIPYEIMASGIDGMVTDNIFAQCSEGTEKDTVYFYRTQDMP
jgi:hypothetical protein